MLIYEITGF